MINGILGMLQLPWLISKYNWKFNGLTDILQLKG